MSKMRWIEDCDYFILQGGFWYHAMPLEWEPEDWWNMARITYITAVSDAKIRGRENVVLLDAGDTKAELLANVKTWLSNQTDYGEKHNEQ